MRARLLSALKGIIAPIILTSAALAIGLLAAKSLRAPIVYPKAKPPAQKTAQMPHEITPLQLKTLSAYAETLRRPLFSPVRRAAPVRQAGETQSMQLKDIELQGIIIDAGAASAVFLSRIEGEAMAYKIGDDIADWTIKDIEARSVTLRRGDAAVRLELTYTQTPSDTAKSGRGDSDLSPAARRARRQNQGRVNAAALIDGMEN